MPYAICCLHIFLVCLLFFSVISPGFPFWAPRHPRSCRHELRLTYERLWEPSSPPSQPAASSDRNLSTAVLDLLGSRTLGLDWGHKKIGVALTAGFSQRPLGTIINVAGHSNNATRHRPTIDQLLGILRAEGAIRIVIGYPLFRDGTLSPQANATKVFARMVADRALETGVMASDRTPFVYLWDERLTSQAAKVNIKTKSFLHSSDDVDSQAACLILEDFYRHKGYEAEVVWPIPSILDEKTTMGATNGTQPAERRPLSGRRRNDHVVFSPNFAFTSRANFSYDEWRRAELLRYGREFPVVSPSHSKDSENGAGTGKKKKKRKKKK